MIERFTIAVVPSISSHVMIILNNLGGCSQLEMSILTGEVCKLFGKLYTIERIVVGSLMTSLEMHGISLTLMRLENVDEEL